MFQIGQKVLVVDQYPPAEAVVLEASDWGVVNDVSSINPGRCYRVSCPKWLVPCRWIGENNLQALPAREK